MVVLPFQLVAIALALVFFDKPVLAHATWGVGLLWTPYLLNVHATDALNLDFQGAAR